MDEQVRAIVDWMGSVTAHVVAVKIGCTAAQAQESLGRLARAGRVETANGVVFRSVKGKGGRCERRE